MAKFSVTRMTSHSVLGFATGPQFYGYLKPSGSDFLRLMSA